MEKSEKDDSVVVYVKRFVPTESTGKYRVTDKNRDRYLGAWLIWEESLHR